MDLLSFVLPYIPSFLIRWYWTEERIAKRIKLAICDDRRGVYFNGAVIPSAEVYLRLTNLSAFHVTVETIWADLVVNGGRVANLASRQRRTLAPSSEDIIHLEATITGPQCQFLKNMPEDARQKAIKDRQVRVLLEGNLSCRVRDFQVFGREASTANVEFANF